MTWWVNYRDTGASTFHMPTVISSYSASLGKAHLLTSTYHLVLLGSNLGSAIESSVPLPHPEVGGICHTETEQANSGT